MTDARPGDREIRVLLVEDDRVQLDYWLPVIRAKYSPESEGARSYERVRELINGGYSPSLVIHDCCPLFFESDQKDDAAAGDALYRFIFSKNLPVVIHSGSNFEFFMQRDPYQSDPPITWISKPITEEKIDEAVDAFRKWSGQ